MTNYNMVADDNDARSLLAERDFAMILQWHAETLHEAATVQCQSDAICKFRTRLITEADGIGRRRDLLDEILDEC